MNFRYPRGYWLLVCEMHLKYDRLVKEYHICRGDIGKCYIVGYDISSEIAIEYGSIEIFASDSDLKLAFKIKNFKKPFSLF
jgi:hypothetical protein